MGLHACVVGATGLVGAELVRQLGGDDAFDAIHLFARRPVDAAAQSHIPVSQHLVDFNYLQKADWPACDVLFCCLGTTIKAAGSKAGFRQVDFDFVIQAAQCAKRAGATKLIVISAMGADPKSAVFYNRVKGEMEVAVASLGFQTVVIVRPSLLTGERSEHRFAERLAISLSLYINGLIPKKYRPVPAKAVAQAMRAAAKDAGGKEGVRMIESDSLQNFV